MSSSAARTLIRGGRVFDPRNDCDQQIDLLLENGRIHSMGNIKDPGDALLINASGCLVIPGLTDLQVRTGGLGAMARELRAAARGGIGQILLPPDTSPVLDTPAALRLVKEQAQQAGAVDVQVLAALTKGLEGKQLSEMQALKEAGCIGMTNLDHPMADSRTLLRCLEYAATCEVPVFFRPVDRSLAAGGCAHQGYMATRLGLRGIPASAETTELARNLLLVEQVGVSAHFGQISCERAVELLRDAQSRGLNVTADVTAHHLLFDESSLEGFNTQFHVLPPLRTAVDRQALLEGLRDGTLQAVCSDHRPHDSAAKHAPFAASEAGMAGTETLLGALLSLVEKDELSLACAIESLTAGPGRIIDSQWQGIQVGAPANLCVIDAKGTTEISLNTLNSFGVNNPHLGKRLPARVVATLQAGRVISE